MGDRVSRRTYLQVGITGTALSTAGCLFFGGNVEYQPVVVRNHRETAHTVKVVFDRGDSHSAESRSAQLSAGAEERFDEFVPSSDYGYPYRLETHVDGNHVKTTPHRWESDAVILNLRTDGTLHVSNVEPNELVTPTTERATSDTRTTTATGEQSDTPPETPTEPAETSDE